MALPPTIYRVAIELADSDNDRYATLRTTVACHPSETAERLVVRLLAYALQYEEGLAFTKGVSAGDDPDLWTKRPDGRVKSWIEVGLPDAERLLKAGRHVDRVVLFAYGNGNSLRRWKTRHLPKLSGVDNTLCYELDETFVGDLVARLQRSINWSLTVAGGAVYLEVEGETFETVVSSLGGEG